MVVKPRILHIDGLRGVAVLFVIFYHFFPDNLKGGFIGVDMFFVISGYVIQRQLNQMKRYDFLNFYTRRALRIFPSLIIVLLSVILLGKYFFLDYPLRLLYNSAIFSSFLSTNYYFFANSNYFDLDSISKPLLPLWSLAVEEQFYLLWPLLFWVFQRRFKPLLYALIFVSLTSALWFGTRSESYNFFSLQTRFWEIALGILAASRTAISVESKIKYIRAPLVFFLILVAITGLGEENWPGISALLVVLASIVLIAAPGTLMQRSLSNSFLLFVGKVSFPLYLVHWPILSFYSSMNPSRISGSAKFVLILISFLIAWLLTNFVELPVQQLKGLLRPIFSISLTCLLLCTGYLSYSSKVDLPLTSQAIRQSVTSDSPVIQRNAWYFSGRSNIADVEIDYACSKTFGAKLIGACRKGSNWSSVNAIVVGDSKAEIVFRALLRSNDDFEWGFIGGGLKPVIPLVEGRSQSDPNHENSRQISEYIASRNDVEIVVIVSAARNLFQLPNDYSLTQLRNTKNLLGIKLAFAEWIKPIHASGKKILIMRDNPTLRDPTYCHGVFSAFPIFDSFVQKSENTPGCYYKLSSFYRDTTNYRTLLDSAERKYASVKVVDATRYLCDHQSNRCELFKNNKLLYSYTDHLSDYAADIVASEVGKLIKSSIL